MQCLSTSACRDWLARVGIRCDDFAHGPNEGFVRRDYGSLFSLPGAQSHAVARAMVSWLTVFGDTSFLVNVFEHGIWPSSENLPLYYTWRRSLHSFTTLDAEPGHEFISFEQNEMISLVQFAIISGWGVFAASGDGRACLMLDHDGNISAFADLEDRARGLESILPPKAAAQTKPSP